MNSATAEPTNRPQPTTKEKLAIAACWLVCSVAGAAFIVSFWSQQSQSGFGWLCGALFVGVMAGVSLAGYLLYEKQPPTPSNIFDRYWEELGTSLVWQVVIVVFAAQLLDGGRGLHVAFVALAAYWLMVALIVARRPRPPTDVDWVAIRHGYPMVVFIVACIGPRLWVYLGRW